MKSVKKITVIVAVCVASAWGSAAHAGPILVDQWYAFLWQGSAPADVTSCGGSCGLLPGSIEAPGDAPWTISGSIVLKVTDAFNSGDRFEVFNNLTSAGTTSALSSSATSCGPSVDDCFADTAFSSGTFDLGNGDHSLTFTTLAGSASGGAGYFRAENAAAAVPAPATLALLGLGLLSLRLRRKA